MINTENEELNVEIENVLPVVDIDDSNVELDINTLDVDIDSQVEPLEIESDVLRLTEEVQTFIPQTSISTYIQDKVKYLKVSWNNSPAFINYIKQGRVKLYLYKYTKSGRKVWNETVKSGIKKWVHPANRFYVNNPSRQCWGIRSFSANPQFKQDIDNLIENSEYPIANNGLVKTEYLINTYSKGEINIPLNDIISPIIKVAGKGDNGKIELPISGDNKEVKLMGVRQKTIFGRCNQPIKFCLVIDDELVGSCLNVATVQLFKYRITDDNHQGHGYKECLSLLPDIGYSVYIK